MVPVSVEVAYVPYVLTDCGNAISLSGGSCEFEMKDTTAIGNIDGLVSSSIGNIENLERVTFCFNSGDDISSIFDNPQSEDVVTDLVFDTSSTSYAAYNGLFPNEVSNCDETEYCPVAAM